MSSVAALTDPTKPADYIVSSIQEALPVGDRQLRLQSLLISETRQLAVINGRSYGVGEVVEDAEITLIDRSGVTVVRSGKEQRLPFQNSQVEKIRTEEY